ncbi:MAG: hypothetical protein V3T70_05615 [Phycisphaerae bacterium]
MCLYTPAPDARSEPRPSPAPIEWELQFTFQDPKRIVVKLPGEEKPRTFWYLLYRVTNDTGEERDFMPLIERVEEIESEATAEQATADPDRAPRIRVTPSLIGLDPLVYRAIRTRHAKTHPFLVPPVEAIGRIKQGRDNAIDSVAVFEDLDPRVNLFTIYFSGLSGERRRIPNPQFRSGQDDHADSPRYFVIQKTLAIPFRMPGDARARRTVAPVLDRLHWVMR